jgi:predicted ABC-class ATPase
MRYASDLAERLLRIDGRNYGAYKDLDRAYLFEGFVLRVDHVQGDPFAAPSRVRVQVPARRAGFERSDFGSRARRVALCDFLCRRFAEQTGGGGASRGSGRSGAIEIAGPGQEVLERSAVLVDDEGVEARFTVGLPARGRRILGREARAMLCEELPRIVERSLLRASLDGEALTAHLDAVQDQAALRAQLPDRRLVAFVADGAQLPRRSGIDDRPMEQGTVPFRSPESLRVALEAPHRGRITGMGIPEGVTLIVGGGYHGKSTLLKALERGVYDHLPGDGRELVVTVPEAVKVRAEDGRSVVGVDISPFIDRLPMGRDTGFFSTSDASGSTSQAAAIVEAVEVGARALLLDEDTSATNFLIRDARMQELIRKDSEPITPLLDKVRQLHREVGVSTILVMGGSGDYFDVADTVVAMESYRPWDATAEARGIASRHRAERTPEGGESFGRLSPRSPRRASVDPRKGRRDVHLRVHGTRTLVFGTDEIDLGGVEQLVDVCQTRAIAEALDHLRLEHLDQGLSLAEVLDRIDAALQAEGLDGIQGRPAGDLARFRRFELAAALNRLRPLQVRAVDR